MATIALTAELVARATTGRLLAGAPATTFTSVSIDSRTIEPGALFVAIRGERVDGHAFVRTAFERGAAGALVSHNDSGHAFPESIAGAVPGAIVLVSDTIAALQHLGREVRRQSGARVIAITGSAGKTSTKELIADVLSAKYRVYRNRGNLNNHIGLPLSLTGLAGGPDVAVVELGMNHAGEIRTLVGLAEPDVRVWTNVGDAHIGHFGSREMVARAKAEILEAAASSTVAIVNADDPLLTAHVQNFPGRLVTFGFDPAATVRATGVTDRGFDGTTVDIRAAGRTLMMIETHLPGRAHLMNVLAAVAAGLEFGVAPADLAARVSAARAVARRGADVRLGNGARVIDDSYNASPAATSAMLQALSVTEAQGRRIAILGEMLELGQSSLALHEACGRQAALSGVDVLVAVGGPAADGLVAGAVAAGLPEDRTRRYADATTAASEVPALIEAGDLVLVKGSRGTRMDLVVDRLAADGTR
ncbi:MAG TPA: UDP-N-acetylmuramoyl-tripeptide--D-alanyl-D-alanine ligase [Vicinamibacterales bacterium]|nr:UDP-N-acetylmuramoyl-tripeptide--D-alanyl-D-alanine ligase [Vicinamibacterales bacterium]